MQKRTSMAVIALLAGSLAATSAIAHPTLMSTSPPADTAAANAPTEIRLSFSEGVISKFSGVELKDQSGKKIATGKATTDPKDQKQLVIPLNAPLQQGTYTVDWHVVSVDTHRVKGTYSFKVAR